MTGPRRQNTPTTLRTFVALPLPTEIHQALKALQNRLKRHAVLRPAPTGVVRWVDPESIHLTLHFLGDILPERVEPIKTALTVVARNVQPFAFQTGTLGAFPNLNRPQVIWVGVQDPTSWLTLLHAAVNEALASLGFQPEQRHFSPHLTLGRVQRNASRAELHAVGEAIAGTSVEALGSAVATDLIFFRSVLKPTGPEYTPLGTFKLGA